MVEQEFVTSADQLQASGTPLRKIRGKLVGINPRMGEYKKMIVDLDIAELTVIESIVPYNYPSCQLTINYSARERSAWGMLIKSSEELGFPDLKKLCNTAGSGPMVTLECEPEHVYGPDQNNPGQDIKGVVWTVVEVDQAGAGGGKATASTEDPMTHMLKLLDGKDATEFAQAALKDPVGRTAEVSAAVMDNTLIAGFVDSGQVVEGEDGKFHVIGR
jgi:hypothetical protein|tara:strand:+ start:242 stop:892 length:651 start_codon:yes stop_codon:yes gene_type:complete